MAVPLPERQLEQSIHVHPDQRALGILAAELAVPAIDAEDEAEPGLAVLAKTGPANGAAQQDLVAFDARLFADLPAKAGHDVLVRLQLAAQPVVLAEMWI